MKKALLVLVILGVAVLLTGAAWAQDKPAAPADPTGEWEGLVPDQNVPFTLKLKVENDKITGEVVGQGAAPITAGTWSASDATLTITFTYVDGAAIQMSGVVKGDQVSGTLTYGGQMTMSWTAKKKAQ